MPENGIVYVLSNPAMPGLYKIGITPYRFQQRRKIGSD